MDVQPVPAETVFDSGLARRGSVAVAHQFVQRTSPCVGSERHLSYRPPVGLRRESYSYTSGGPVPWDRWVPVVYEVKWSQGSDGYLRVSIDGTAISRLFWADGLRKRRRSLFAVRFLFATRSRPDKQGAFLGYSSAKYVTPANGESHTAPNSTGSDPTNRCGSASSTSANRQSTVRIRQSCTNDVRGQRKLRTADRDRIFWRCSKEDWSRARSDPEGQ